MISSAAFSVKHREGRIPLLPVNPSGFEFGPPGSPAAPTLFAGLLGLDYNNIAKAAYNGLTVTALERLSKVFYLNANYTYARTIDNGNFTTFINVPQV